MGENNSPSRIKTLLIILNCSLIAIVLVLSISFYWIAKPRLEQYFTAKLHKMLPEGLEYKQVRVHLYPLGLYIEDLTFKRTPAGQFSIPIIRIRPNLRRLFNKKIKIESISIERPEFHLPLGSRTDSFTRIQSVFKRVGRKLRQMPLFETTIGTIRIHSGTVRIHSSLHSDPVLTLHQLDFSMGPFSFPRTERPTQFKGRTHLIKRKIGVSITGQLGETWSSLNAQGRVRATEVPMSQLRLNKELDQYLRTDQSTLNFNLPFQWSHQHLTVGTGSLRLRGVNTVPLFLPIRTTSSPSAPKDLPFAIQVNATTLKVAVKEVQFDSRTLEHIFYQSPHPVFSKLENIHLGSIELTRPRIRIGSRSESSSPRDVRKLVSGSQPLGKMTTVDSIKLVDARMKWERMDGSNPFRAPFTLETGTIPNQEEGESIPVQIQWAAGEGANMEWIGAIDRVSRPLRIEGDLHVESVKLASIPFLSGTSRLRHVAQISGQIPVDVRSRKLRVGDGRLNLNHVFVKVSSEANRTRPDRRNLSSRALTGHARSILEKARKIQIDIDRAHFRLGSVRVKEGSSEPSFSFLQLQGLDVDSLQLVRPLINVSPSEQSSYHRRLTEWMERLGGLPGSDPLLRIDQLKMHDGLLRLYWPRKQRKKTIHNLALKAGADTSDRSKTVRLTGRGGIGGCSSCLRLSAYAPGNPSLLEGELRLDGVPMESIANTWIPELGCRYASFSGYFPFSVQKQGVRVGDAEFRVENALFEGIARGKTNNLSKWKKVFQGWSARSWYPQSMNLTLRNIRWKPTGNSSEEEMTLDRAHLRVGGTRSRGERPFVLGELHMKKPRMNLSVNANIPRGSTGRDFRLSAHLDFPELSNLNLYLDQSRDFPFAIQSGKLSSDINGSLNLRKMDLKTSLKFENLSLQTTDPNRSEFLKTSISLLLFYLYQSGGDLNVRLAVTGPYENPEITRLD